MTERRYIVSRRDFHHHNVTRFLQDRPDCCGVVRWTLYRDQALRLSFEDAHGLARWWNSLPANPRLGIKAKVEDDDPPPAVSEAA